MATIVPKSDGFSKGFAIGSSVMELAIKARAARQSAKRAEAEHQMKITKYGYDIKAAQLAIVGKEKDIQNAAMTEMRTQLDRQKASFTSMGAQGTSLIAQGAETKKRISQNMTGNRTLMNKEEMEEMREAERMIFAGQTLQTNSQVGLTNMSTGNKMTDSQVAELQAQISRGKDVSRLMSPVVPATAAQQKEVEDMRASVKPKRRAEWNVVESRGSMQEMRAYVAKPDNAYDPTRLKLLTNATQLIATQGFQTAMNQNPVLQATAKSITAEVLGIATGKEFQVETTEGGRWRDPTATIIESQTSKPNASQATPGGGGSAQQTSNPMATPVTKPAAVGAKTADQQMQEILRNALQGE